MTIQLPEHLKRYVHEQVVAGHFRSEDDVVVDALERQRQAQPPANRADADPLLGAWRDDAELLDEIVEHAMKNRREQPWRLSPSE